VIDSHCHLTAPQFAEDLDAVLQRATEAGVSGIVVVGDTVESSREALQLARTHAQPLFYATAGVHPHNAKDWDARAAESLRSLCAEAKGSHPGTIIAVGEVGLDFHYDFSPREKQIEAFVEQIEIAREVKLPLVMHCRSAYEVFLDLIRRHDVASIGGVVHCFSGTLAEARELIEMGFAIGVTGALTFKKSDELREMVRSAPTTSILLETDAPYLAPAPHRGKRNEPALVMLMAQRLAQEWNMPLAEIIAKVRNNTIRTFGLAASPYDGAGESCEVRSSWR
jgi:TatD DNase family protein